MELIFPSWPAPANVRAAVTTRLGGVSSGAYARFNLGDHVGDDPAAVNRNRALLEQTLQLPSSPIWLRQVHGVDCLDLAQIPPLTVPSQLTADAAVSGPQSICAILTADCLPVLFCSLDGERVGAAHAGWRGLCEGVLENTVSRMARPAETLMAWLGPAIGVEAFQVGDEVRDAFLRHSPAAADAFFPWMSDGQAVAGKWACDLYLLARQRLAGAGVTRIFGGEYCTFRDAQRFFSYRREPKCGRMASLIWLDQGV